MESGHKPMAFMRVTKGVDEHPVLGLCQILGVPRLYLYIVDPMLGGGDSMCKFFWGSAHFGLLRPQKLLLDGHIWSVMR